MSKNPSKGSRSVAKQTFQLSCMSASPIALVGLVREGVSWQDFRNMISSIGLTDQSAAGILQIPLRTLARRKGKRLEKLESERLIRLVRLVKQATEVLGSKDKALQWLNAPNRALEGEIPMTLLDTDIGTQAVEAVLTRIEYGVFS